MAKAADLKSNIQSKIQKDVTSLQQKTVSSTQATQAGSTVTPEVTSTPKVTQTAKAMPSITRPDISQIATPTVSQTPSTRDLFAPSTTPTLRKADTPDLLGGDTEQKGLSGLLNKWLYEKPQEITQKFTETDLFDKSKNIIIDTARFGVSTVQGWLERYGDSPIVGLPKSVQEGEIGTKIKEQRNETLKSVFDELESRDQGISKDKGYEEAKKRAEEWSASGKSMRQALQEGNWDVYLTRGGEIIAQIIPALATSIITKNPKAVAGTVFTTVYGDAYKRNLTDVVKDPDFKDLTGQQKTDLASLLALTEAGIETIGDIVELAPFMKGKTSIAKMLGIKNAFASFIANWQGSAFTEGLEEVSTEALQTRIKQAYGSLDSISLKELWQIFSDTYALMQVAGLPGGAGGVVETRNRNRATDELSREADKYDNFNDFEAAAERGGVEDKEIIQDAWAKSKGLTSEQTEILKYDVNYVDNQEKKTTKLYEEREETENKINKLKEEGEERNKSQITKLENRVQEIDNQINEIDKSIQEYMELYGEQNASEEKELEELHAEVNQSIEGEDLSEQTMKTSEDKSVVNSTPIEDMDNNKILDARKFRLVNKPQTPQERKRQKDIENEMEIRMNNYKLPDSTKKALEDLTFDVDNMSIWEAKAVIKELDRLKKEAREEKRYDDGNDYTHLKRKVQDKLKDLLRMDEERAEAKTEQRDKESILPDTPIDDKDFFDKWSNKININKYALKVFLLDRKHIPGLKGIKISGVENLSESEIMEVAKNAATVAGILGIDFNKVLDLANVEFSVLNLKGEDVKGTEDISGKLYLEASKYYDILKMAIILKDTGPSVFGHELMHLLDKEYLYRNGKLWTGGNNISRASILKDASFKTYNVPYLGYKFDDKDYWDTSREILARFAEQYIAKQVDEREYKALTGREFYWSDKEFNKLVPKFEKIIARFSEFMLDKGDKISYPEIMRKIADLQYKQTQFSLGDESQMKYELIEMKSLYDDIQNSIGDIKDETIRLEMEAELSTLYSNYEMLNKMKDEYIQKQKTSPQVQDNIDGIVETVIPNPSENPQTIRLGLPYYGGSNIENGIGQISEGNPEGETTLNNSNIDNSAEVKINRKNKEIKIFFSELGQAWHDAFTPAISRIYNISPRIAGRLITMEAQTDINIHRYRQKAKGFVETLGNLKKNKSKFLEVKKALLDYGALASQQTEDTIVDYKKEEVRKLREVLLKNGFKEQDINDMFSVLDDIGRQYEAAGLSINLTDIYFPRSVIDYEGLIGYMSKVSGQNIALNKITLLKRIRDIQNSDKSDAEKEAEIRRVITNDFKQPGTTSQNAKERKIGKLSDWGDGIYAYYANPIEALDHYIVSMTNAIQRQLFLGGIKQDSDYEGDILNQTTSESISNIIDKLVADGMISDEDLEELKHSVLSVINKKKSPKAVTAIKNITYITTITNFLSALNQLDDLGMAIIKDRSGLKNVVKAIFGKANIKYDDLGLDDAYEMFREEGKMTNWLFSKSFFNAIDRLGKTSFINAAWESLIHQYSNEKTREYLHTRLVSMYGEEAAKRMEEKIKSKDYKGEDGQIDIEILRDLLYQLGSTQPIFTSAMPTAYLNHPWVRLCYALSSFTIKRIDWLVQGTKEVNAKHGKVAAGAWLMGVTFYLALFGAAVGDIGDWLKGKKEETFLWQFIENGIEDALKTRGEDMLTSWLKIWDLSEYDLKIYQWQGLKGVVASKIAPFIFDLGDDVIQAIWKHDLDEATDLVKYIPIFGKLVYYNCLQDIGKETKKKKDERDFSGEEEWDFGGDDEWDFSGEEEWDFS